jgi:diadenosine tetraphosphate (Ap4A) HIT family hydrolase
VFDAPPSLPDFVRWPSFPFEGELRVRPLRDPVGVEPPRKGEDGAECVACKAPDEAYIWVSERWRVRAMDRPSGLPVVLILESRSHLDLGDLPNLLAAELGVMTVRIERAVRSLDGVARVHVNRWGDGSAHLHMWFLARPYGHLQLRGTFLSLWDDILPPIPETQWRENLALVAAWLAEFGGRPLAEPPQFQWQTPLTLSDPVVAVADAAEPDKDEPSSVATAEAAPERLAEESSSNREYSAEKTRTLPTAGRDRQHVSDTGAHGSVPDGDARPVTDQAATDQAAPTAAV